MSTDDKRKNHGGKREGSGRKKGKTINYDLHQSKYKDYISGLKQKKYYTIPGFLKHADSDPLTIEDRYTFKASVENITTGQELGRKKETGRRNLKNNKIKDAVLPSLKSYYQENYIEKKPKAKYIGFDKKS